MSRTLASLAGSTISLLFLPTLAFAHPGHGAGGLAAGFLHPVFGIDHVLAMLLVGVIAARIGGRGLWLLPTSFVGMMIAGGILGTSGVALDHLEIVIAASLVVFGAAAATSLRIPVAVLSLLTGGFALFHGYAHGAEMPAEADATSFALGFVAATAVLHAVGIALWLGVVRYAYQPRLLGRIAGIGSALVGMALAAGLA
jgi:urease accessory protein